MKWTRDNWITIPGYAISELHLSGNELLAYGLIAGFSHDGESQFSGTLDFIGDALNVSPRRAMSIIGRLIERGLIQKTTYHNEHGHLSCRYRVTFYDEKPIDETSIGPIDVLSPTYRRNVHRPIDETSIGTYQYINDINKERLNIGVTPAKPEKPAKPVKFDYKQWLLEHDVPEATANDWLQVRKAKKASNTLSAAAALEREALKAGITIAQAVQLCAENSWQGFRAEYLQNRQAATPRRFLAPGMVDTLEYTEKAEKELMRLRAEREAREKAAQLTQDNYEFEEDPGVLFPGH